MLKIFKHTNAAGYSFEIPLPHSERFCGPICKMALDYVTRLYLEGFFLEDEMHNLQRFILLMSANNDVSINKF